MPDDKFNTTVCDMCGIELHISESNHCDIEGSGWIDATLCNDCYAEEKADCEE